jgi:DNA (cytosine-5)-methyltransferase 1
LSKKYRVLDLFAGIGGLSLGFELASLDRSDSIFEIICAVEIDPHACDTLRKNLEKQGKNPDIVIQADLTEPETHDLIIKKCEGQIDIIIGGPPCQSFSHIGARSAAPSVRKKFLNDDRDELYLEYMALVHELKPSFLVMENVTGIITKKDDQGKPYIKRVVESIQEAGYNTYFPETDTDYIVLNAADFGVPQHRERVFIIANRYGVDNILPRQTNSNRGQVFGTSPWVSIFDAIGDLPNVYPHITMWGIPKENQANIKQKNLLRNRGSESMAYHWEMFWEHFHRLDDNGQEFLRHIMPKTLNPVLTAHVARGQQQTDIELFTKMKPGTSSKHLLISDDPADKQLLSLIKYDMNSFLDKYRKHEWNSVCTTIFAHMQKDGNRFIHPDGEQARTFTVREAARIQSFPDDFEFTAPGNVRYKYIGNAVPPLLAKAIAISIARALNRWTNQKSKTLKITA